MAKKLLSWDISDLSGWYSENDYFWALIYSENVNISKAWELRLTVAAENNWSELATASNYDFGVKTYAVWDSWDLRYWTKNNGANDNWAAFKNGTATSTADVSATAWDIQRAQKFLGYILLISNNKIDKLNLATDTTANDSNLDFTNGWWNYYPSIVSDKIWSVVFGNWNYIYTIWPDLTETALSLTLPESDSAVYIAEYLNNIYIYCNSATGITQYVWDWESEFPNYINRVWWYSIIGGATVWSQDFLSVIWASWSNTTTYKNQWIMLFSWTQHSKGMLVGNEIGNCFVVACNDYGDNVTAYRDWVLYRVNDGSNYNINYTYYDKYKGWYVTRQAFTWTPTSGIINSLYTHNDTLYRCQWSANGFQPKKMPLYDYLSTKSYNSTWYVRTVFKWYDTISYEKELDTIKVSYSLANSGQSISIYGSSDWSNYYLIKTISDHTKTHVTISKTEIATSTFWTSQWNRFEVLSIKILLTRWATATATPEHRRTTLFYVINQS